MLRLCHCGRTFDSKDGCPSCHKKSNSRQQTTAERGYDHRWRKLSEKIRAEEPLCVDCLEKGKVTPAEHCHHKIKIKDAPALRLDRDNVVPLCIACHDERTKRGE